MEQVLCISENVYGQLLKCQKYTEADLIDKANIATERHEIEALKIESEKYGISINFDDIWETTKKETHQHHLDSRWFQLFGI